MYSELEFCENFFFLISRDLEFKVIKRSLYSRGLFEVMFLKLIVIVKGGCYQFNYTVL